jgi:L-ascorbate metabolism protein UlaG (beta-lactamase superfamily)
MKIKYFSHSCFEIKSKIIILTDPFFSKNPLAPKYEGNPDLILVTHEHFDHSDTSRFDSLVVCPVGLKLKNSQEMKIGEKRIIEGVRIEMVTSTHPQSSYPTGFVFEVEGKRLYHPGDTYIDGVKPLGNIDLFFVPIGGYYTMNIAEAVEAMKIIKPKLAIPMHYNTFPQIGADPEEFKAKAEKEGFKVKVLKIGEEIEI